MDGEPEAYRDGSREGFTQKEMLLQILEKLDTINLRLNTIETLFAVHASKPLHDEGLVQVTRIEKDVEGLKSSFRYATGGLGVLVFVSPFIYHYLNTR